MTTPLEIRVTHLEHIAVATTSRVDKLEVTVADLGATVAANHDKVLEEFGRVHGALQDMREEFRVVHGELASMREEFRVVHGELASMREEFRAVNARLDRHDAIFSEQGDLLRVQGDLLREILERLPARN